MIDVACHVQHLSDKPTREFRLEAAAIRQSRGIHSCNIDGIELTLVAESFTGLSVFALFDFGQDCALTLASRRRSHWRVAAVTVSAAGARRLCGRQHHLPERGQAALCHFWTQGRLYNATAVSACDAYIRTHRPSGPHSHTATRPVARY